MTASASDAVDWVLFSTELLSVLRSIRDELQKIADRLAELSVVLEERP